MRVSSSPKPSAASPTSWGWAPWRSLPIRSRRSSSAATAWHRRWRSSVSTCRDGRAGGSRLAGSRLRGDSQRDRLPRRWTPRTRAGGGLMKLITAVVHGGGTGPSPEGGHGMRVQGRSLALAALVGVCLTAPGMLRAQSGAPTPVDSAAKQPDPPTLAGFKLTGFAAGPYAYSGRRSGDTAIVGRWYDRRPNRFMLNALAVVLDKPYDPAKFSAGFHTELLVGQDATVIQSGGFNLGSQADLPHLYVTLNVPTASGNGLQFKVGRIPTLL